MRFFCFFSGFFWYFYFKQMLYFYKCLYCHFSFVLEYLNQLSSLQCASSSTICFGVSLLHFSFLRAPTVQQRRRNVRGESETSGWGTAGILQLEGSQQPQADPAPHRTELLPHPSPPPLTQVNCLTLTSQVFETLRSHLMLLTISQQTHPHRDQSLAWSANGRSACGFIVAPQWMHRPQTWRGDKTPPACLHHRYNTDPARPSLKQSNNKPHYNSSQSVSEWAVFLLAYG